MKKTVFIFIAAILLLSALCINTLALTVSESNKVSMPEYGFSITLPSDWMVGITGGSAQQNGEIAEFRNMTVNEFNAMLNESKYLIYSMSEDSNLIYMQSYTLLNFVTEDMPDIKDFRNINQTNKAKVISAMQAFASEYNYYMAEEGCSDISITCEPDLVVFSDIPYVCLKFSWTSESGDEYETLDYVTLANSNYYWICYYCFEPPIFSDERRTIEAVLDSCTYPAIPSTPSVPFVSSSAALPEKRPVSSVLLIAVIALDAVLIIVAIILLIISHKKKAAYVKATAQAAQQPQYPVQQPQYPVQQQQYPPQYK